MFYVFIRIDLLFLWSLLILDLVVLFEMLYFLTEMKVLIISNMYPSSQKPYSGIFVKNQYENLKAIVAPNEEISLLAMERTFTGPVGSIAKYIKFTFKIIPLYFKKIDVVHLHFFFPLIIPVIFFKLFGKTKLVVTFHGSDIHNYFNNKVSKFVFSKLANKVDHIIAVGNDLKDEIELKLSCKVHHIISAGVDDQTFKHAPQEKLYDFIFVGSFVDRKGVTELTQAIEIWNDKSVRFCFVGSGILGSKIKELQKAGFKVTVKENQTQTSLGQLYNQSKYFVLPSKYEPFGLVATEAIFCGTPAVVSTSGGLKEQVKAHHNGFLINRVEPQSILNSLQEAYQLKDSAYQAMVENCLVSNKEYSLSAICHALQVIYKR